MPKYLINAAGHPTGDLGWVRQDWTTLGATVTVHNALTTLSITLLVLALAIAAVLMIASALAGGPARSEQMVVLSALGWTRRRILRWQTGPQLVLAGLVCAVAVVVTVMTGGRAVTLWPAVLAVAVALAGLLVVGASGVRRADRTLGQSRRPRVEPRAPRTQALVGTPLRLALRAAAVRPSGPAARAVSWAAIGAATAGILVALAQAQDRVGATRLAGLAVDRTAATDIALGAVAVVAGVVMIVLARRIERHHRTRQHDALRLTGWTRRDTRRLAYSSTLIAGTPALLAAAVLGLVNAQIVGGHHWLAIGTAVAVTVLIMLFVLVADARQARQ